MTAPFGLLLVTGAHTHQENYAPAFAADPRCRLIGLADEANVSPRRRALNRQLADELRIPVFDDLEAALCRDDVDLVSICAEPERRGRITELAARSGKHVYLDKEPAVTPEGLRGVIDALDQAGVLSQTFSLVHAAPAARARSTLESGRLGELTALHAEVFFAKGPAGTADLSRPRRESAAAVRFTFTDSKRELLCVGWYPLVLFQWLTGRQFTAVTAVTSNYFFQEHQRNGVEDFAALLLEMQGGLQATITVGRTGWCSHASHGVQQVYLVGREGTCFIDAYRPRLEIFSDAPPFRPPETPHPEDPMGFWSSTQREAGLLPKRTWRPVESAARSDAAHFLDCLEAQRPSDVPAAMGVHAVEVVLAAYRSAAMGQTVRVT